MKNTFKIFFNLLLTFSFLLGFPTYARQTSFERWCSSKNGYIDYAGGASCRFGGKIFYKTYDGASDFEGTEFKIEDKPNVQVQAGVSIQGQLKPKKRSNKVVRKTSSTRKTKKPHSKTDTTGNVESAKSIVLKRPTNARSSIMFFGRENVIKTLPAGTSVYIHDQKTLPSGATALKIEITAPENLVYLNQKKPFYIWQSQDEMKSIRNPSSTEADTYCEDETCNKKTSPSSVNDLKKITAAVEETDSLPDVSTTKEKITLDDSNNDAGKIETSSSDDKSTSASSKKFSSMSKEEKEAAIKRYSNSPQVDKTVAWSSKHGARAKGIRRCYQWVKEALATKTKTGKGPGKNLIPSWFSSAYAKYAAKDLLKYGFVNLIHDPDYKNIVKDPKKIPRGAVLVYTRKGHRAGHAEIKLDEGAVSRYASDYTSTIPRADRPGYTLIGVMIKPNL